MDIQHFQEELLNLISNYTKCLVNNDGALCTNYVFMAEFVDGDGQFWTLTAKEDSAPIWRTKGLINYILEQDFTTEKGGDIDG